MDTIYLQHCFLLYETLFYQCLLLLHVLAPDDVQSLLYISDLLIDIETVLLTNSTTFCGKNVKWLYLCQYFSTRVLYIVSWPFMYYFKHLSLFWIKGSDASSNHWILKYCQNGTVTTWYNIVISKTIYKWLINIQVKCWNEIRRRCVHTCFRLRRK